MKCIFSKVYRVTQKDFYALPYTSVWAPFVARQISKRYSSSCHVFINMWGVRNSTASMIRCLKSTRSRTVHSWVSNTSHADKHMARAWISFRYLSSYKKCPHWSVRKCIKIFLSYSVHCWKNKFHKAFRYWNKSMYFCIPLARTGHPVFSDVYGTLSNTRFESLVARFYLWIKTFAESKAEIWTHNRSGIFTSYRLIWIDIWWEKSKKSLSSNVTHHCQNPQNSTEEAEVTHNPNEAAFRL